MEVLQKEIVFNKAGYFKYTDHYSSEPDNVYIEVLKRERIKISVSTFDNVYQRGKYILNYKELKILLNMIKLAWQNYSTNYKCTIMSNNKNITVKTEKTRKELERNKHMTIKINDVCIFYGLDIEDSRNLYRLIVQILNHDSSNFLD